MVERKDERDLMRKNRGNDEVIKQLTDRIKELEAEVEKLNEDRPSIKVRFTVEDVEGD